MSESNRPPHDGEPYGPGPIDDQEWPERFVARAVGPGPDPTLHGYSIFEDLIPNYNASERALTAFLGEAPNEDQIRRFDLACGLASVVHVGDAPVHASVLASVVGARPENTLGLGATVLAEQARHDIDRHAALIAHFNDGPRYTQPERPSTSLAPLIAGLKRLNLESQAPKLARSLTGAAIALFCEVGLTARKQLAAALVWARFPTLAAEAIATSPGGLLRYPLDTPGYRYTEEE
ncbi:MAG: hypothetical protein KC561_07155 [Myxococcales bacterium]|nr:hypothetical protein [Myxococcales bacterium]